MTILNVSDAREVVWKWRCKLRPYQEFNVNTSPDPIEEKLGLEETIPERDPSFGADACVKTFFEGPKAHGSNHNWVDYPPRVVSKVNNRVHDRVAIKVFKVNDPDKPSSNGCAAVKYHQIQIQNPHIVAALAPIVRKHNCILLPDESATFEAPFQPLWFAQGEIRDLYNDLETTDPLRNPLQLLVRILDDMFVDLKVKHLHLKNSGLVDFKTAWMLFPKGSSVYSLTNGSDTICKVDSTFYAHACLEIVTHYLRFNGRDYVWQRRRLSLKPFDGYMPVTELEHCPLEWLPEGPQIKARCIARGKKMLDFQGVEYCSYKGLAMKPGSFEHRHKYTVEGRILIDIAGYNKFHPGADASNDAVTVNESGVNPVNPNRTITEEAQKKNKDMMLKRVHDLAFSTHVLEGYALRNKEWLAFDIDRIEPVDWNEKAFSHLVYDAGQKDLILSFVENHVASEQYKHNNSDSTVEDVIVGKGQGLITLLSGPPGTGKTLTAEAVADRARRPLYHIHAEDLGVSAATLGANLKLAFDMAIHWGAVVLLDEADVFMAKRSPNDIRRNELVSIFLRELEYFRGILFLTTNLYHTIDTAFRSRVNMHLLFPQLSQESRASVWRSFLGRLPPTANTNLSGDRDATALSIERPISEDDIQELSRWDINGREIRNSAKMAHSWCTTKGYLLTLDRAESGIKVTAPNASKDVDH